MCRMPPSAANGGVALACLSKYIAMMAANAAKSPQAMRRIDSACAACVLSLHETGNNGSGVCLCEERRRIIGAGLQDSRVRVSGLVVGRGLVGVHPATLRMYLMLVSKAREECRSRQARGGLFRPGF